ncbi:hypothetical protein [Acetivibrio clariflavus]|uniref:Uncharacterized protein n=1 Tax=Acetivibrio clariflavus (strain DSM 19732 / NBRC 101661 / EBR45) TaxID=720554 RepID=G8LTG8_ACECE|nr:hypothetical protein [Acetivibrio clariflavus]AEV69463.1 hypothetical protein Clocl_2916 [Acetivibrio clariflavus DSM 19732]HOQ01186.1 hypothetical protein [Acetivibrio clariflavus]
MIINMNQTRTFGGADFVFSTIDNYVIYTSEVRLAIMGMPRITLIKNNEPVLLLRNKDKNPFSQAFKRNYKLFDIIKPDGETCGKLSHRFVGKFLSGYTYEEITFNSEVYNCYDVGMGKEGTFVCIYSGDEQIAMIEKPPVVYDNKDFYKIYIKDDRHAEIVCLFATYYDHSTAGNYNEITTKEINYRYTTNKELKSKYNPLFKELCN